MASEISKEHPASNAPLEQAHRTPKEANEVVKSVSKASVEPATTIQTQQPAAQTQPTPELAPQAIEDAPDPDDDDLSDLDHVLDEFAATTLNSPTAHPLPNPNQPSKASSTIPSDPLASLSANGTLPSDDEFAASLQAGMAELLADLDDNPAMQQQFQDLMKELSQGVTAASSAEPTPTETYSPSEEDTIAAALAEHPGTSTTTTTTTNQTPAEKAKAEGSFQETIRATMERMSASSASAAEATSPSTANPDDFLSAMLAEMEKGGGDASSLLGGAGGDEDFSKLLLGMMEQLTNKEILYEPMKELHDKFPAWMDVNRDICPKADLDRYLEQQRLVGEITRKFEEKGYADPNVLDREYIVDRMQKMQSAGAPPPGLVGDMNAAQEALEGMDQGCAQQ